MTSDLGIASSVVSGRGHYVLDIYTRNAPSPYSIKKVWQSRNYHADLLRRINLRWLNDWCQTVLDKDSLCHIIRSCSKRMMVQKIHIEKSLILEYPYLPQVEVLWRQKEQFSMEWDTIGLIN
jgi:hypothetical protein